MNTRDLMTLLVINHEPGALIRDTQHVKTLVAEALVEDDGWGYKPTPRGKAMVAALTGLPLPQGEIITKTMWAIPGTDFEFAESEL